MNPGATKMPKVTSKVSQSCGPPSIKIPQRFPRSNGEIESEVKKFLLQTTKGIMLQQHRKPLMEVDKYCNPDNSIISIHLYIFSEGEIRVEVLRMLNKLKEIKLKEHRGHQYNTRGHCSRNKKTTNKSDRTEKLHRWNVKLTWKPHQESKSWFSWEQNQGAPKWGAEILQTTKEGRKKASK